MMSLSLISLRSMANSETLDDYETGKAKLQERPVYSNLQNWLEKQWYPHSKVLGIIYKNI